MVPEKYYLNADTDKVTILSDNKGKSGVYRWKNTINGKSYIGSAIDLRKRFYQYYNVKFLENHSSMYINRSLLKHGYSKFSLEILEYCLPEEVLTKENAYIKILPHEYNILPTAGSPLGSTKSGDTKKRISDSIKGTNHPNYGKDLSPETKKRISDSKKGTAFGAAIGKSVEVLDLNTNEKTIYASGRLAAKDIGVFPTTIFRAIKSGKQIKKRWKRKFIE